MKTQDKPTLEWDFDSIPHEMKALKQWNLCYIPGQKDSKGNEVTTKKRPIGGPKNPFAFKTLDEIKKKIQPGQYFGFCITPEDDIAVLDIDDELPLNFAVDDLPSRIQMLLEMQPSYAEISPSQRGLHLVYSTNKGLLAHRKDQDKSTKGFKGSVFLRNQFVTVTGHVHSAASQTKNLKRIDASLFEDLTLASAKVKAIPSSPNQKGLTTPNYTLRDVQRWLSKIPPNITESTLQPLLNRAYARFDPPITHTDNYDHWMNIAFAVHFAANALGQTEAGEDLFWDWSSTAENDGEQNTRQKYRDCAPKHDGHDLTHLTLINLASSIKPQWPYPIIKYPPNKEPIITDQADTGNLLNWEALFKLYELELSQNEISKKFSISSIPQIQSKYFKEYPKTYESAEEIKSAVMYFAQDNHMARAPGTHAKEATTWWVNNTTKTYNPVKRWIDEAPPLTEQDKQVSYFQALWETIELYKHDEHNEPLYRSYMKKNLMGIIRAHYYKGPWSHTTGIVILQGGETAHKSSWVENLLPLELQEYIVSSGAVLDGDAKKLSLEAGVSQIWVKNEVESFIGGSKFMNNKDSALKSFLVDNHDFYRPLFGKLPIKVKRKCIFFGTTNESELQMSGTGNRRMQIIPVKDCDGKKLTEMPLVKVYQELLAEFLETPIDDQPSLWVLSPEEEKLTNQINDSERKMEASGDTELKDVFDFEVPYDIKDFSGPNGSITPTKLTTIKVIRQIIYDKTFEKPSIASLKHSLKRQVGKWTDSVKRQQTYGNWSVEAGMAKYRLKGKVKKSGYMMPPVKANETPFEKEMK